MKRTDKEVRLSTSPSPPFLRKIRNPEILLAFSAAGITFVIFLKALQNGFVNWDDNLYVYGNVFIRSLDARFFRWAFTDFQTSGNWHPLTWLSHALDYRIWGIDPTGHHLTSVLLHAMNTFLVVILVVILLESARRKTKEGALLTGKGILIAGFTTGLLFGIHPLHVESVAWVSERKDVLCAFFYLLSLLLYAGYAEGAEEKPQPARLLLNRKYLLALIFFVLALLSKPMAVTLPLVLLILDWFPYERIGDGKASLAVIVEKAPFFVLSIAFSAVAVLAQASGGSLVGLRSAPLQERLAVAASSLVSYLREMLLPLNLSPFYPYPKEVSLLSFHYLWAFLAVAGITAACLLSYRKRGRKLWLAVWTFYVITLLPVLGLVQIGEQSMADRYSYLPSIGLFLIAGLAVAAVSGRIFAVARRDGRRTIFAAGTLAIVAVMSYITIQQIGVWKDGITLWDDVIGKEPGVSFAYNNRGLVYDDMGLYDRAMKDYDRSIALKPDFFRPYNNRGVLLIKEGMLDEAIRDFDKSIALNPSFDEAYMNRGIAYDRKGLFDKSTEDFSKALSLNPLSYETLINRGVACGARGLLDEAIQNYSKAISINPYSDKAFNNMGVIYYKEGLYDKAVANYSRALAINPGFKEAHYNRAMAYMRLGIADRAAEDLRYAGVK
jgi:tetratricopeptide (TPR) repeat protein